jgi:acetyltransferase-like isoleucine patch superfamily enzyme
MKTKFTPLSAEEHELLAQSHTAQPALVPADPGTARIHGPQEWLHITNSTSCSTTLFNTVSGHIYVGAWSFFGQDCAVLTGEHPSWKQLDNRQLEIVTECNHIVIGKGVWIASRAIIIGPCRIGDHAVIAAGSVVLPGDYEGGCLYAGNPAVFKKRIEFDPKNPPKSSHRFV